MFIVGGNDKQEQDEENYSCTIIEAVQPSNETAHLNKDATSAAELESGHTAEEDQQQDHNEEENSCVIVDAVLSPTTDAAHQKESTTSSEFELGIVDSSNSRQVTSDSPIKVPKVTEEFSQDTFVQLNIKGMDIFMCVVRTIYHKTLAAIETDGFGDSRPTHQVLYLPTNSILADFLWKHCQSTNVFSIKNSLARNSANPPMLSSTNILCYITLCTTIYELRVCISPL